MVEILPSVATTLINDVTTTRACRIAATKRQKRHTSNLVFTRRRSMMKLKDEFKNA
jgi:hypothetical protein